MFLLAAQLTVLEVAIFLLAALAFFIAVRFFLESRRTMDEYLKGSSIPKKRTITFFDNISFRRVIRPRKKTASFYSPAHIESATEESSEELKSLRSMIMQQQNQLTKALHQINNIGTERADRSEDTGWQKKVKELELLVDKKEGEIKKLQQQTELSKKMQLHFDKMQNDFEALQQKLQKLEQQAREANELAIKLDHLEQSNEKIEKDLLRKEDRLREITAENQRLQSLLHETEDKLQESNLQRQQVTKKLQFLEEINTDMKEISDTNKKLQSELRRIAELESMLNLITEERDELLKKRQRKI